MSYLRIGLLIGGAALLAFLGWRVILSFEQGEELDRREEQISQLTRAIDRDSRIAGEMAEFRAGQGEFQTWFQGEMRKKPLTTKVEYVNPTTGEKTTCDKRDHERYRELFNSAVAGTRDLP
jgi:hypothetical protein